MLTQISHLQKAGKRAKKDPNAPKRGQSAYMLWLNANRKSIAKAGMSVTDVSIASYIHTA